MSNLIECKSVISEELNYYYEKDKEPDEKDYDLIGFKNNLAVIMKSSKVSSGKLLRVEIDPVSGEKFLNLNGKKIKMIPQATIPENLTKKTTKMNIFQTNTVRKIPSTLKSTSCMLKSVTIDTKQTHVVNNEDNAAEIRKKPTVINKTPKTLISSDDRGKVEVSHEIFDITPTNVKNSSYNTSKQIKVTMEALNLTNYNKERTLIEKRSVLIETTDKSTQKGNELRDAAVQTDDFNDNDLLRFIEENLPSICNTPTHSVNYNIKNYFASKSLVNSGRVDEKKRMFFEDLRSCLVMDNNGNLPIHHGVINKNLALVKRMCIVLKARKESVNLGNHNGCTPLQLCIIYDSGLEIVKTLLQNGADLGDTDSDGNNVIHMAVRYERTKILEELLEHAKNVGFGLDAFNFDGITPLMLCCSENLFDCAALLIKYNADVNVRDRKSGRTALFYAAESHDADMVKLLLDNNADTKIKNFFGTSPHDAMYEVDEIPKIIKSLILGKFKRKSEGFVDEPEAKPKQRPRNTPSKKTLKTVPKYMKIKQDEPFMRKVAPPCK